MRIAHCIATYGPSLCVDPTTPNATPGAPEGLVALGKTPNRPYVLWSTLTYRGSRCSSFSFVSMNRRAFSGGERNFM